jgi:hypothetical protein
MGVENNFADGQIRKLLDEKYLRLLVTFRKR